MKGFLYSEGIPRGGCGELLRTGKPGFLTVAYFEARGHCAAM